MQDSKLINKVITISSVETKAGQFGGMCKIKDENGHTFTVYEKKKDGTTSVAWEQLQTFKIGTTVQIGFAEQPGEYQGKKYISRIIRTFNEDVGSGVQNAIDQGKDPYGGKTSNVGQNIASSRILPSGRVDTSLTYKEDDNYWDKKAYKQCLWGYWLENAPKLVQIKDWKDMVWDVFKEIEEDADNRFNPSPLRQAVQKHAPQVTEPDLPTIQQDGWDMGEPDNLPPF